MRSLAVILGCGAIALAQNSLVQNLDSLLEPPKLSNYRIFAIFGQKELDLSVQAILNQKALIHNNWYRLGDRVGTFYIRSITNDEVVLVDKKMQQKVIKLKKKAL